MRCQIRHEQPSWEDSAGEHRKTQDGQNEIKGKEPDGPRPSLEETIYTISWVSRFHQTKPGIVPEED